MHSKTRSSLKLSLAMLQRLLTSSRKSRTTVRVAFGIIILPPQIALRTKNWIKIKNFICGVRDIVEYMPVAKNVMCISD